jgi:DNA polymerase-3 subunit delta'
MSDDKQDPESDQEHGCRHPRSVGPFLGHEAAEAQLAEAAADARLHHAWLITGPKGLGKATLAYRFARQLLGARMAGPRPFDAAAQDPVTRQVEGHAHPDLFVLRRGLNDRGKPRREITADEARELSTFFHHTAGAGGWRVAVIDAVDDLNRHAANAILKILEEPPAKAVLLLICHAPGGALATIRSRCRRLALRPLGDEVVAQAVHDALEEPADQLVLTLARGRPGAAIALQASGASATARQLQEALADAPRKGAAAMAGLPFGGGDAAGRCALILSLAQDWARRAALHAATGASTEAGEAGRLLGLLAPPGSANRWSEAWAALHELDMQADGLGQDPTHTIARAGHILAEAAGA